MTSGGSMGAWRGQTVAWASVLACGTATGAMAQDAVDYTQNLPGRDEIAGYPYWPTSDGALRKKAVSLVCADGSELPGRPVKYFVVPAHQPDYPVRPVFFTSTNSRIPDDLKESGSGPAVIYQQYGQLNIAGQAVSLLPPPGEAPPSSMYLSGLIYVVLEPETGDLLPLPLIPHLPEKGDANSLKMDEWLSKTIVDYRLDCALQSTNKIINGDVIVAGVPLARADHYPSMTFSFAVKGPEGSSQLDRAILIAEIGQKLLDQTLQALEPDAQTRLASLERLFFQPGGVAANVLDLPEDKATYGALLEGYFNTIAPDAGNGRTLDPAFFPKREAQTRFVLINDKWSATIPANEVAPSPIDLSGGAADSDADAIKSPEPIDVGRTDGKGTEDGATSDGTAERAAAEGEALDDARYTFTIALDAPAFSALTSDPTVRLTATEASECVPRRTANTAFAEFDLAGCRSGRELTVRLMPGDGVGGAVGLVLMSESEGLTHANGDVIRIRPEDVPVEKLDAFVPPGLGWDTEAFTLLDKANPITVGYERTVRGLVGYELDLGTCNAGPVALGLQDLMQGWISLDAKPCPDTRTLTLQFPQELIGTDTPLITLGCGDAPVEISRDSGEATCVIPSEAERLDLTVDWAKGLERIALQRELEDQDISAKVLLSQMRLAGLSLAPVVFPQNAALPVYAATDVQYTAAGTACGGWTAVKPGGAPVAPSLSDVGCDRMVDGAAIRLRAQPVAAAHGPEAAYRTLETTVAPLAAMPLPLNPEDVLRPLSVNVNDDPDLFEPVGGFETELGLQGNKAEGWQLQLFSGVDCHDDGLIGLALSDGTIRQPSIYDTSPFTWPLYGRVMWFPPSPASKQPSSDCVAAQIALPDGDGPDKAGIVRFALDILPRNLGRAIVYLAISDRVAEDGRSGAILTAIQAFVAEIETREGVLPDIDIRSQTTSGGLRPIATTATVRTDRQQVERDLNSIVGGVPETLPQSQTMRELRLERAPNGVVLIFDGTSYDTQIESFYSRIGRDAESTPPEKVHLFVLQDCGMWVEFASSPAIKENCVEMANLSAADLGSKIGDALNSLLPGANP